MKIHNYVIIFCAFVMAIFIFWNYKTQRSSAYSRTNIEYANALTAACHDAAKTIRMDLLGEYQGVWRLKSARNRTLNMFYSTLSRNFGSVTAMKEEEMKEKTPIVVLVDVDGFYISYNAAFDEYGNSETLFAYDKVDVVSSLNTWSEMRGTAVVRYYLSEYVDVTLPNGTIWSGNRKSVYDSLHEAGKLTADLAYLNNGDEFRERKQNCVASKLEKQINYYLNTQTINISKYNTGYNVTMPASIGEDWARMTKNPTVIAFMQGNQEQTTGRILNVYAYCAGELTNANVYFIYDGYYYPITAATKTDRTVTLGVSATEYVQTTVYVYNGTDITKFYFSEEDCAAEGALPWTLR